MRRFPIVAACVLLVLLLAPDAHAWYNSSWQYRKNITIDASQVNGTVGEFPLLVRISSDTALAARVQPDADDIVFTDASDARLDHEIERYTTATGGLVAWVRIPSLSNASNTTIFLYYGNSSVSSQQNKTGVWGSSFLTVWHLNQSNPASDSIADSTANGHHANTTGSMTVSNQVGGIIDGSFDFDGSDDRVKANDIGAIDGAGILTVTLWAKPSSLQLNKLVFGKYSGAPAGLAFRTGDAIWGGSDGIAVESGAVWIGAVGGLLTADTWGYWSFVYNGSESTNANKLKIFYNGVQRSVSYLGTVGSTLPDTTYNVTLAGAIDAGYNFAGGIDEVRVASAVRNGSWIQTEYNNQKNGSTFVSIGSEECNGLCWYSTSWLYRKNITIDASQVNGTHSNFPVLVRLSSDENLLARAQADADDVLFTSVSGTKLDHEIEFYNSTNGALVAWVRVPTLSNASNTTLFLYYSNSLVSSQQNGNSTWDANYTLVWHMKENLSVACDGTKEVCDSTNRNRDGDALNGMDASSSTTGPIGRAYSYDAVDDYLDTATAPANLLNTTFGTMSAWAKPTGPPLPTDLVYRGRAIISDFGEDLGIMRVNLSGVDRIYAYHNDGVVDNVNTTYTNNQWTHLTWVLHVNGTLALYADGLPVGSTASGPRSGGNSMRIARTDSVDTYWNGSIDEVRFSNTSRSSQWIWTEYNNQKNGSTFMTLGTEQALGRAWYDPAWRYSKAMLIDASQVNGTHVNFPLLVRIANDSQLGSYAQSDADDLLFVDATNVTKLDHEIEFFDGTLGELVAWVRLGNLSNVSNTTIFMYYGNSTVSSQQNKTGVWGTEYTGVWHLSDGYSNTTEFYKDSSANLLNGTLNDTFGNSSQVNAIVGKAIKLGGGVWTNGFTLGDVDKATGGFTMSAWINFTQTGGGCIFDKGVTNTNYYLCVNEAGAGSVIAGVYDGDWKESYNGTTYNDGAWHYVVGSVTTSQIELYIDGSLMAPPIAHDNSLVTNDVPLKIGIGPNVAYDFSGTIDEPRLTALARNATWLQTEYNNQKNGATMVTLGSQQVRDCNPLWGEPWQMDASYGCSLNNLNVSVPTWTILGSGNVTVANTRIVYRNRSIIASGLIRLILVNNATMVRT